MRALILQMRDNFNYYKQHAKDYDQAYAFADAAYNGGLGGLESERRACKLASWCDPTVWYDNVEKLCLKSPVKLYGNRSACEINRHHVRDVLITRSPKYKPFFMQH